MTETTRQNYTSITRSETPIITVASLSVGVEGEAYNWGSCSAYAPGSSSVTSWSEQKGNPYGYLAVYNSYVQINVGGGAGDPNRPYGSTYFRLVYSNGYTRDVYPISGYGSQGYSTWYASSYPMNITTNGWKNT